MAQTIYDKANVVALASLDGQPVLTQNVKPATNGQPEAVPVGEEEEERTRELYKYWQPQPFRAEVQERKAASNDTVLTSYAQLVAWRLDARRCTISYFDEDTQYNVAEGTKTLDLDDGSSTDNAEDCLWMGATSFDVKGSICLHTLAAEPGRFDVTDFEVSDLTEDNRFSKLPFVTGYPKMRYYYGTTFRTKKGVSIGTVCVLDDKPRPRLTEGQRRFMKTIADNVMLHLELLRDRAERNRATRMNVLLSQFINPEATSLGKRKRKSGNSTIRQEQSSAVLETGQSAPSQPSPKKKKRQDNRMSDSESSAAERNLNTKPSLGRIGEDDHLRIFHDAAHLLRTSLDIEDGGGVVFLDTANSKNTLMKPNSPTASDANKPYGQNARRSSIAHSHPAEVLASSITSELHSDLNNRDQDDTDTDEAEKDEFSQMPVQSLLNFVERYPQGKLWSFDSNGTIVSDSDSDAPINQPPSQAQAEAGLLLRHFPASRQVILLPLWDSRSTRWTVCFAYSTSKFRTLNVETDFLYCVAFCNCVTIEMGRLATMASDQLKGDFISSISHELRSPLHGILASCEFLQDTEVSSFQASLIHTVGSCARTLLDTISMILDYTKINAFERDWRTVAKKKKAAAQGNAGDPVGVPAPTAQPTLNIYGNVDISQVTEEVVESVTAGQQHQDVSNVNFALTGSKPRTSRSTERDLPVLGSDGKSVITPSATQQKGKVEVILDVEPHNYQYVTQPGAFRRVVMNLVGNSLKYTTRGWIKIQLDIEKGPITPIMTSSTEAPTDTIILTVTDTGKGISAEYLRTKLFQAFAQEDHLASGTGLGLSMVRSILKLLNGDIDIVSTVGVGTKVTVRIPMISQSSSTASNTPSTGSSDSERSREDSIDVVRNIGQGKRFAIFKQDESGKPVVNGLNTSVGVHNKIVKYVTRTFGLDITDWSPEMDVDIVITEEDDLLDLLKIPQSKNAVILVYCVYANRPALLKRYEHTGRIEIFSKPFGPYKLARALCSTLNRLTSGQSVDLHSIPEPGEPESAEILSDPSLVEGKLTTENAEVNVLQSGAILARDDSTNARMAVHMDISPPSSSKENKSPTEFPFVEMRKEGVISPGLPMRPALRDRRTMSPTTFEMNKLEKNVISSIVAPMTTAGAEATEPVAVAAPASREPRLLLVDDNHINLHLLHTYMKKRKYSGIHTAKDGLDALQQFKALSESGQSPDIVFMDISMPVMNGFESTRQIRAFEESRNAEIVQEEGVAAQQPSALIIALTGLASGNDQSEAFIAGVDLYMTKPVSFKEVGRLLDNWIRNGGAREGAGVPFGALTGAGEPSVATQGGVKEGLGVGR